MRSWTTGFPMPSVAILAAAMAVAGCGKSEVAAPRSAEPERAPSRAAESVAGSRPSVAGQLGNYVEADLSAARGGADGWSAYRNGVSKALAAVPGLDERALIASAFADVGAERDSFKRDDLIKGKGPALAELKKSATPKIHIRWGTEFNAQVPTALVYPYDAQSQSYRIQLDGLSGYVVGRAAAASGGSVADSASYRINLVGIPHSSQFRTEFFKKIPAEQARAVEALIAPLRPAGTEPAALAVSVYGTVAGSREPTWNSVVIDIDADAIGLHLPKAQKGAPTLVIDGPEIKAQ